VSHTFVLREVRGLRRAGVRVDTISIWRTSPDKLLSRADREEADTTFAALPAGPWTLARSQLGLLARRPVRYFKALAAAWRLAAPGVRGRLRNLAYFAEAALCWPHIRRLGVRHVHAQFTGNAAAVALVLAELEHSPRRPFTWSMAVHGPLEFYDVSRYRLAEKVERARLVVAISDYARSQLMGLVPDEHWPKVEVVHCGVDPETFAVEAASASPDGNRPFEILSVGRLVSLKGHGVLLDAMARLRDRGVEARATIVGDGPHRRSLEESVRRHRLADRVQLIGAVGQDEIRDLYARSDVFCLPSFGEGVPVVLMEAMSMAKPVVTSRITGIPELVDDGVSGLLTAPGRADQVADALERLAGDPAGRRRMGEAGREKVVAEFSTEGTAQQLARIYAERLPHATS